MDEQQDTRQEDLIHCEQVGVRVGYDDGLHATLGPDIRPDRLANRAAATIFRRMLDSYTVQDRPLEEAARIALGYRCGYLAGLTHQHPERGAPEW